MVICNIKGAMSASRDGFIDGSLLMILLTQFSLPFSFPFAVFVCRRRCWLVDTEAWTRKRRGSPSTIGISRSPLPLSHVYDLSRINILPFTTPSSLWYLNILALRVGPAALLTNVTCLQIYLWYTSDSFICFNSVGMLKNHATQFQREATCIRCANILFI